MSREKLTQQLLRPIDGSSLAVFRILFGLLMVIEQFRLWPRLKFNYLDRPFLFKYDFFHFVVPWPELGMKLHVAGCAVLATMMLLGVYYRFSAWLFFLGFSYLFLLEQALYLNHLYLVCLLALLLAVTSPHAVWSIDAWVRGLARPIPYWHLAIFRAQIVLMYFFAGVAKINSDWLAAQPIRQWLLDRAPYSSIGWLLSEEWFAYFIAYGGLCFDLLIGFALLHRKLRWLAIPPIVFFHLSNAYLFSIGIFPWLGLAATVLFLDPDHPRRLWNRFSRTPTPSPVPGALWSARRAGLWFFFGYLAVQLLLPLRHWYFPGDLTWTEEGHRFSWRMKLRNKRGELRLLLIDPVSGQRVVMKRFPKLTIRQYRKMATRPDMLHQYVQHLANEVQREMGRRPQIYVDNWVSLNGRPYQRLVDHRVDLAAAEYSPFRPSEWILPLKEGLQIGIYPDRSPLTPGSSRRPGQAFLDEN